MRLTKKQTATATQELLDLLAQYPDGLTTSQLGGTKHFHGEHTLRNQQIIRLVRATGRVTESTVGRGMRTASLWRLK